MFHLLENMAGKTKQVKITVSGTVQMVGFRYFTLRAAKNLGIRGYVRNLPIGKVEIVAEGAQDLLHELIGVIRQGPEAADVRALETDWSFSTEEKCESFDVRA